MRQRVRSLPVVGSLWRTTRFTVHLLRWLPAQAAWVYRLIKQEHPDLVHLNDSPSLHRAGLIACWLARQMVVCHVRSMAEVTPMDRLLSRYVHTFVFISQAVADDQHAKGLRERSGRVIYNGIDIGRFATSPDIRLAERSRLGFAPHHIVVGVVARLVPWKGQREFLQAFSRAAAVEPQVMAVLVGSAEAAQADYVAELRQLTANLRITDRVRFLGYHHDMPRLMAALDMLVHVPQEPEPFGRVVVEAMASGVPVIAGRTGGLPEIIEEGKSGILVHPSDYDTLALAILHLARDPDRAASLRRAGQERAKFFSLERHVAAVEEVYRTVLGARP